MLTGNSDVDEQILLTLDLQDRYNIFISNKYMNQLCKNSILLQLKINEATKKAKSIINKNRISYVLMFADEYLIYENIKNILVYLDIYVENMDDYDDCDDAYIYIILT